MTSLITVSSSLQTWAARPPLGGELRFTGLMYQAGKLHLQLHQHTSAIDWFHWISSFLPDAGALETGENLPQ